MDIPNKISNVSINSSNQEIDSVSVNSSHKHVPTCISATTEDNNSLEINIKNLHTTSPLLDITKQNSLSSNLTKSQVVVENINALSKEASFDSDSEKLDSDVNFRSPETLSENLINSDTMSCSPHEGQQRSEAFSVSKFYTNYGLRSPELSSASSDSSIDLDLGNCLVSKNDLDEIPKNPKAEIDQIKQSARLCEENELLRNEDNIHSSNKDKKFVSNATSPTEEMITLLDKTKRHCNLEDKLKNVPFKNKDSSLNVTEKSNLQSSTRSEIQETPFPNAVVNIENNSKESSFSNILESGSSYSDGEQNKFEERKSDLQEKFPSIISLELENNMSESCKTEDIISPSLPINEPKDFGSLVPQKDVSISEDHNMRPSGDPTSDLHNDSVHSFIEDDDNIYAVAENISITAEDNAESLPYDSDHDMESDLSLKYDSSSSCQSENATSLDRVEDCSMEMVEKTNEFNVERIDTEETSVSSATEEETCLEFPKLKEVEENIYSSLPENNMEIDKFEVKEPFTSKSEKNIKEAELHSDLVLVKPVDKVETQHPKFESYSKELESSVIEKRVENSECMIENFKNNSPLSAVIPVVIESSAMASLTSPLEDLAILENITKEPCVGEKLEEETSISTIKEPLSKNDDVNICKGNENSDCLQESLLGENLSKSAHSEETESDTSTDVSESSICTAKKSENIIRLSPSTENLAISTSSQDSLQRLSNQYEGTAYNKRECSPVKSSSAPLFLYENPDLINESEDIEMESLCDDLENETLATSSSMCKIIPDSSATELDDFAKVQDESIKNLDSLKKSFATPCESAKENITCIEEAKSPVNIVKESVKSAEGLIIPNSSDKECNKIENLEMENLNIFPSEESLKSKIPLYTSAEFENSDEKKPEVKILKESCITPNTNKVSLESLKKIELVVEERKGSEEYNEQPKIYCMAAENENIKSNPSKESDSASLEKSSVKPTTEEEQVAKLNNSPKACINTDLENSCSEPPCDIVNMNNEQVIDLDTDLNEKQALLIEVETYFRKKDDSNVLSHVDMQQEFLSKENFDWDDYLEKTNTEAAPPTAFLHVERSLETGVHLNQVLEVLLTTDEKSSTDSPPNWVSYWPAKVVSSCGCLLRLKYMVSTQLTSANTFSDFWCDLSSPKIRPLGWSKENNIPMQPPPEFQSESECIFDEETLTTLDPVPEEAFNCEKREFHKRLPEGTFLEVLDLQNPYDGMIVKVLKNVGGRLLLNYIEDSVNEVVDKITFWLFFLDKRIRPLGWIYKQGEPYRYKHSNFKELLKDCDKTTPERSTSFLSSLSTPFSKCSLEEGMYLEAFNPINSQNIHVAVVSKVLSDSHFELKIDDHSWVTTIEDPFLVPCGFSEENCLDLIPPNNYSHEEFSWKSYVALDDSRISPCEAFKKHTLSSELGFDVGQKLEVASPLDPDHICIATIERVLQHMLLLKLDSNPNFLFYRSATSMDNFPTGWAHSNSYALAVPYWYMNSSRSPSANQIEENDLSDNNLVVNVEKSPWTNYNSLWCPRLFINHCCYPGPYLSKTKVSKMSQSVGPGPLPLVLHDVISMTINAAYIPTRVLRELQNLRKMHSSWQSICLKAKFKRHILKAGVIIPSIGEDIPTFLLEFSRILMSCPNLWSFDNIGENCPLFCNKQNFSMMSSGAALYRGRGGLRGSVFRRKKGGKKRLFYPIKSSAINNEDNTEEFCYPFEGEEVEEVNSESEGESRPSSPASTEVQRKLKPKRILSSLEITMNDSRSTDVIKERSTKRSRGEIETDFSSRQQTNTTTTTTTIISTTTTTATTTTTTTTCLRTEDTSSDRKKARIEEKEEIEAETEAEAVIYGLETAQVDSDPLDWSIDDVERYVSSQPDISHHAVKLKEQEVDGRALLLLNLPSLIHHMGLPHSVAVILAQHICKVKMAHFVNYYPKYSKKVT